MDKIWVEIPNRFRYGVSPSRGSVIPGGGAEGVKKGKFLQTSLIDGPEALEPHHTPLKFKVPTLHDHNKGEPTEKPLMGWWCSGFFLGFLRKRSGVRFP